MFDEKDFLRELSRDPVRVEAARAFLKTAAGKGKCDVCPAPMTKKILWAEGKAYIPSCDEHVSEVTKKHQDRFDFGGPDGIKKASVAAAAKNAGNAVKEFVKTHPKEIAAALVGAATVGGVQYMASKKGKDGGLSAEQKMTRDAAEKTKDSKGFVGRNAHVTAKAARDFADVHADHPVAAGLKAAPLGGAAGLKLLSMFKK
jgi:hypothetical protein